MVRHADHCLRKLDVVVTREKCLSIFIPRHSDLVLKPFLGKNFGRVAWTPFVMIGHFMALYFLVICKCEYDVIEPRL